MSNQPTSKPLTLGVIFLTIFIDLVGFSIIFPLFPAILDHYLAQDGDSWILNRLLDSIAWLGELTGGGERYTQVLFGGILGSLYATLQFFFSPFWGSISDRYGRRPILLITTLGMALSYVGWIFAGSFGLLVLARVIGGAMSGNLSVATAAVSDVTTKENRSKGMGIIGAAFGLGFVFGPALGGFLSTWNPIADNPDLAKWGLNPFSVVAGVATALSLMNFIWVALRFNESLPKEKRGADFDSRNPIKRLLDRKSPNIRKTNLVYLCYILAFSGMEFTLVFLGAKRFDFETRDITYMMIYVGFILILVQGGIVRRLAPAIGEKKTATIGLVLVSIAFCLLAIAPSPTILYLGLTFMALGAGLCSPTLTSIVSFYADETEQGAALGTFRAIGSLGRAIGPIIACLIFWWLGSESLYFAGAAIVAISVVLCARLPNPRT